MISLRIEAALAVSEAHSIKLATAGPAYGRELATATHRDRADRFSATVRDEICGMAGQSMSPRVIPRRLDRRAASTARGGR